MLAPFTPNCLSDRTHYNAVIRTEGKRTLIIPNKYIHLCIIYWYILIYICHKLQIKKHFIRCLL